MTEDQYAQINQILGYKGMPTLAEILADPANAPVPGSVYRPAYIPVDEIHIHLGMMLASVVDAQTMPAVWEYMQRLHHFTQLVAMKVACARNGDLVLTDAAGEFAMKFATPIAHLPRGTA